MEKKGGKENRKMKGKQRSKKEKIGERKRE